MIEINPYIDDLQKLNADDRQLVIGYYLSW